MEITNEQLKGISELAKRQRLLEKELDDAKNLVKTVDEKLRYVSEVLLPNAMLEAELTSFTLSSGESIEIKRDYTASISEKNWEAAKAWLIANGGEGIIKHVVSLSFGKGEDAEATKAVEALLEQGFTPTDKESIHPQTLKATMKEYLKKGADVPPEVFGLFEIVKSKVTV